MILKILKKKFPDNKFRIKNVNDQYMILVDDEDINIRWKKNGKLNQIEEDILYKHICFRIQDKLAKKKYGDKNDKKEE